MRGARAKAKDPIQLREPFRALFIAGPLVSDLVSATALFRAFKEAFPRSSLCVLASSICAPLLENHVFVDSFSYCKKKRKEV